MAFGSTVLVYGWYMVQVYGAEFRTNYSSSSILMSTVQKSVDTQKPRSINMFRLSRADVRSRVNFNTMLNNV